MKLRALAWATSMVFLLGGLHVPASAGSEEPAESSILIDRAIATGRDVIVSGRLTLGPESLGPALVADDPAGDDLDGGKVPNNLDIGRSWIRPQLEAGNLLLEIEILDPTPALRATPLLNYIWQLDIDHASWRTRFVSAGIAGSWYPPMVDPDGFFRLCNNLDGYRCDEPTTGAFEPGKVTIAVPLAGFQAERGSLITGGTSLGPPIATMVNPVVCMCVPADEADVEDYRIPGGVDVSISAEGGGILHEASVASREDGTWTAVLPRPGSPGRYTIVARSCYGALDPGTCIDAPFLLTL